MNTAEVLNCDGAGKATLRTHTHSQTHTHTAQSSGQQEARSVKDVNKSQTMLAQSGRVSATEIVYCLRQIRATGDDLRGLRTDGMCPGQKKLVKKKDTNKVWSAGT